MSKRIADILKADRPREKLLAKGADDQLSDRASGVIVAHNHPSGPLQLSPADVEITKQLKGAASAIGIEFLDHIIFNRIGYFSFLEEGKL